MSSGYQAYPGAKVSSFQDITGIELTGKLEGKEAQACIILATETVLSAPVN